ncbi:MAG: hypothetical protein HC767_00185 [Akkermansiaceae bacterium]|nr:hypothetical protein [Akkermansiaceae bacterium]
MLTIGEIKRQLSSLERMDEDLIVLVHSGEVLTDDVVPCLCGMNRYNGTGELFLDLQVLYVFCKPACIIHASSSANKVEQVKMRDPVHVFLATSSGSRRVICEAVERSAPLVEVLHLLEDHGLTAHFERSCPVIPKRDDGSSIPVPLMASQTIAEVHSKLQEALACPPSSGNLG